MEKKSGFWESEKGNKSNSRKDSSIVIYSGLLMALSVILITLFDEGTSIVAGATSAGLLFTVITGSAMVYSFQQKKQEGNGKAK